MMHFHSLLSNVTDLFSSWLGLLNLPPTYSIPILAAGALAMTGLVWASSRRLRIKRSGKLSRGFLIGALVLVICSLPAAAWYYQMKISPLADIGDNPLPLPEIEFSGDLNEDIPEPEADKHFPSVRAEQLENLVPVLNAHPFSVLVGTPDISDPSQTYIVTVYNNRLREYAAIIESDNLRRLVHVGDQVSVVDGNGDETGTYRVAHIGPDGVLLETGSGELLSIDRFAQEILPVKTDRAYIWLYLGTTGPAVEQVQGELRVLGYYTGSITGNYDQATETAVRRFQEASGLAPTGSVDLETWYLLMYP